MLSLALPIAAALASCGAAVILTLRRVELGRSGDPPAPAAAAVVFGAAVHAGRPCAELQARLDHAAGLWSQGLAQRIVCSGGPVEGDAMGAALAARGLPETALVVDGEGISTRATVAGARDLGRVLLVSSPWHAHRVRAEARRSGLDALVCPARRSPIDSSACSRRRQLAREVVAIWWYAASGLCRMDGRPRPLSTRVPANASSDSGI